MTKRVIVEDLARAELRQAMRWYEEQRPGKGAELLDEVDGIFVALSSPTTIGVTVPGVKAGVRLLRILLTRFPYAVVYVEHEERVHVVAVAHLKKKPGYPIENAATRQIATSALRWPSGWQFFKGLLGQRQILGLLFPALVGLGEGDKEGGSCPAH
jgi:plasmid stabilization system protein ParE